jgi:hypothetical protein
MARSRRKLEPSKLATQLELVKDDLDVDGIRLVTKGRTFQFSESVLNGEVHRTIDGASTVSLTVNDRSKKIRNSGMLGSEVDINVDGLWFRLVAVDKSGNDLNLTFESREVAILRTYNGRRVSGWGKLSRTRFAQVLMNESPQTRMIPFVCPELVKEKKTKKEDDRLVNRELGFGARKPKGAMGTRRAEGTTVAPDTLTVKRQPATPTQMANIETILDVGAGMISVVNKHRRKIMVCSIMTTIQESQANNLPFGDRDSLGLFQQRPSQGWGTPEQIQDPEYAAEKFFTKAIQIDASQPDLEYYELCQAVQVSAFPKAYAQWRNEAERWVSAYGVVGRDADDDNAVYSANLMSDWEQDAVEFQFARGNPKTLPGGRKGWTKENTWECLTRLAQEVNWRAFETSGKIYFISETQLFKSAPRARLSEDSEGVDWIDYSLVVGKSNSSITITGRASRWAAPPGTTVEVFDNGPVNGRWLVTDIRRGIFDLDVSITCKKPRAKLPEPKQEDDIGGLWDNIWTGEPEPTYAPEFTNTPSGKYPKGKALRDAVLNNPMITFTRASQRQDIQFSLVDDDVLTFLIGFTEAGFAATITSLRTDHSSKTSGGKPSAHAVGKAVDIGNYGEGNPNTRGAMLWIAQYQVQFGFSQLIGPVDELVIPLGYYDTNTLNEHDDHIHVGWPL